MKKTLLALLALLTLLTLALPALAFGPLDINAELPFLSQYVWRGQVVNSEAVLQPNFFTGIMGFGVGFWGNMDLTDVYGNQGQFSEQDFTINYGLPLPLPLLDIDFGLIYYDFPNTDTSSTAEIYVTGSASVLLHPTLEIYYDFKEIDGTYVNASISHPVALSPTLDLDLGASLGYGTADYTKGYFGVDTAGMNNFLLDASVPLHPIPFFTVTPSLAYSTLLGDAKDAVDNHHGDTDAVYFGLSVSFVF